MNFLKKSVAAFLSAIFILSIFHIEARAALVNTSDNTTFKQTSIPTGVQGKSMNVTFTYTAEKDYDNAFIGLAYDEDINSTSEQEKSDVNTYPFETSKDTFERKAIGKIKAGQTRTVVLTARVRKDMPEGYYGVQVYVSDSKEGGSKGEQEYINIWVKKAPTEKESKEEVNNAVFVLGEWQPTPSGKYPNVMNFSINLRNTGKITAQDVVVSMVMDKDPTVFPFDINEANYDRRFEKIAQNETVSLDYSFAIRKEVYTGYYPIKLKIKYKESSNGEEKTFEGEFYVDVVNKEKEENKSSGDFNVNNRTKARIIVESFHTIPEKVIAGEPFELVLNMKNASSNIAASNILFGFDPEKVAESPVFSMENGASSVVVNTLAPGATTEVRLKMVSKPAIDARSYTLKINEKFDSPEFKNADESVNIDIPVHQVAKLKIGNIDLTPTDIKVGEEINLTFPINNTGKVLLYNVSAKFEAGYLKTNEVYVGNIKAGETGNVDVMLTGTAVSDGTPAKITVSYEDDAGNVSIEEKEIPINVTSEDAADEGDMPDMPMPEEPEKPSFSVFNILKIVIPVLLLIGIVVFALKKFKAKKK